MSDAVIREYRRGDIPEMSVLWQAVFGDSEGLVNSFLQLLPEKILSDLSDESRFMSET